MGELHQMRVIIFRYKNRFHWGFRSPFPKITAVLLNKICSMRLYEFLAIILKHDAAFHEIRKHLPPLVAAGLVLVETT